MTPDFSHLIGVPFGDLGRGPDCLDCWGGVIAAGEVLGIEIPDYGRGVHYADNEKIRVEFERINPEWILIDKNAPPEIGDVIVFKRSGGGLHFGIVTGKNEFAQVTEGLGFHLSKLSHPVNKSRILASYRQKIA